MKAKVLLIASLVVFLLVGCAHRPPRTVERGNDASGFFGAVGTVAGAALGSPTAGQKVGQTFGFFLGTTVGLIEDTSRLIFGPKPPTTPETKKAEKRGSNSIFRSSQKRKKTDLDSLPRFLFEGIKSEESGSLMTPEAVKAAKRGPDSISKNSFSK